MTIPLKDISEIKFLNSGGVATQLEKCFETNDVARIAVAYLGTAGLKFLLKSVENFLKNKKQLELIVGISSYLITDWQALEILMQLQKKSDRIKVKYYYHEGFHPKIFIFNSRNTSTIIVGSSNLTNAGLTKNIEANILLITSNSDIKIVQDIIFYWNIIWKDAQPLTNAILSSYKEGFEKRQQFTANNKIALTRTPLPTTPIIGSTQKDGTEVLYWKMAPGKQAEQWNDWKKATINGKGYISMGWRGLGDLKSLITLPEKEFKKKIKENANLQKYSESPNYIAGQFWRFCCTLKVGQVIVAYSKKTIFAIGYLDGEYYYDQKGGHFPHRRAVNWIVQPECSLTKENIWRPLATNNVVNAIKDSTAISYLQEFLS